MTYDMSYFTVEPRASSLIVSATSDIGKLTTKVAR